MSGPARVEVTLLGQKYTIRSEASPEYVRKLVAYVEKVVRRVQGEGAPQDPQKLAVLAALYIADELHRSRDESRQAEGSAAERVGVLLEILDRAAPPSQLSP